MQAVLFIGIPATGKSSFYRERFFRSHVRISLDMLRTRRRERILLAACLLAQQPFVVDNTNLSRQARALYIELAKESRFQVVGYFFQSRVAEAVARNARRPAADRIPAKGVGGATRRLELPSLDEGFDALHFVSLTEEGFAVEDWRSTPS
jgi:predicted kinase